MQRKSDDSFTDNKFTYTVFKSITTIVESKINTFINIIPLSKKRERKALPKRIRRHRLFGLQQYTGIFILVLNQHSGYTTTHQAGNGSPY